MIGGRAPGLEVLKWGALVLMVGDHVNAALFGRSLPILSEIARVVMPVFAIILAFNMAREDADPDMYRRTLKRLVIAAAIATPFHTWAFGTPFPLNVLWTFAAAVFAMLLLDRGERMLAVGVVVVFGTLVDYQWPGVLLTLAAWWFFRTRSIGAGVAVAVSMLGLCAYNASWWALGAVPIVWLGSRLDLSIPRSPRAFYVFYPAHLAVLALVRIAM